MNKLFLSIIISFLFLISFVESTSLPINLLVGPDLKQDAFAYTPSNLPLNKPLLRPAQQIKLQKSFLEHYYYPWTHDNDPAQFCKTADNRACTSVLTFEDQILRSFKIHPGYDERYHAYSKAWINTIDTNMELNTFPNIHCSAKYHCHGIVITNTNIRAIPTSMPSYSNIDKPGQGYPFDNIQEANLWLGTPIVVVHQTHDHKWILIKGPGLLGWVPAKTIAWISDKMNHEWRRHRLVTPIVRQITLNQNLALTPKTIYLGSLLPSVKTFSYDTVIALPILGKNGQAQFVRRRLSNNVINPWPLAPTPNHFNRLLNQLLGMPYGWGGVGFNSDCSGMLERLFGAFGIWLPRNAETQIRFTGHLYSLLLTDYSVQERKKHVMDIANQSPSLLKPYLTLIGFARNPDHISHIALYLGKYPQKNPNDLLIFQSTWGNPIMQEGHSVGRIILGKTVITLLGFGSHLALPPTYDYSIKTHWQDAGIYITDLTSP